MSKFNNDKTIHWLLVLGMLSVLGSGCDSLEKFEEDAVTTDTTTTTATIANTDTDTIPDDQYFILKELTTDAKSYTLHKHGAAGNIPCRVSKDDIRDWAAVANPDGVGGDPDTTGFFLGPEIPGTDITCVLDAEELDLFYYGLNLQIEAPKNICEYVVTKPFWAWKWEPGSTSNTVSGTVKTIHLMSNYDGCALQAPHTHLAGLIASGNPTPDTYFDYDHTRLGGPNCDEGFVRTVSWELTDTTNDGDCDDMKSTVEVIEATGNYFNCAGGPGSTYLSSDEDKIPYSNLQYAYGGIVSKLDDEAFKGFVTQEHDYVSSRYFANFTKVYGAANGAQTPRLVGHTSYSYKVWKHYSQDTMYKVVNYPNSLSDATSTDNDLVPAVGPMTSIYSSDQSRTFSPEPFYTFECQNKAEEVLGRIRLLVREHDVIWNPSLHDLSFIDPNAGLLDYGVSGISRADSSRTMDSIKDDLFDDPFNDSPDWDDRRLTTSSIACNDSTVANYDGLSVSFSLDYIVDPTTEALTSGFLGASNDYCFFFRDDDGTQDATGDATLCGDVSANANAIEVDIQGLTTGSEVCDTLLARVMQNDAAGAGYQAAANSLRANMDIYYNFADSTTKYPRPATITFVSRNVPRGKAATDTTLGPGSPYVGVELRSPTTTTGIITTFPRDIRNNLGWLSSQYAEESWPFDINLQAYYMTPLADEEWNTNDSVDGWDTLTDRNGTSNLGRDVQQSIGNFGPIFSFPRSGM